MTGYHELWLLGDNFMAKSFREHFKKPSDNFFMKENFEVFPCCSSRYSSNNTNMLSRIVNSLAKDLNDSTKLPKYIVIVLDNDLIEYLAYADYGIASIFGEWIEFLADTCNDMVQTRKSQLPKKAILHDAYPCIYWVTAPHHMYFKDNQSRTKLNSCLESVIKTKKNMRLVKMKEIWNYKDMNLVDWPSGRISFAGLSAYWLSVDAAVRYNINKHEQFLKKQGQHGTGARRAEESEEPVKDKMKDFFKRNKGIDKYHWSRDQNRGGHKLPNPSHP